MAKTKNPDLHKKTLNLRHGDFEKMAELFPKKGGSVAVRDLVSAFVDKYYKASATAETTADPISTFESPNMADTPEPETPIAELFARDPYDLSLQDLDTIIEKLRSQRHRFVNGDKDAGKAKPSAADEKRKAAQAVTGTLDLDSLGL